METTTELLYNVPLGEIWADDEWNTRGYITPASAASLADTIEAEGQLQAILLQPLPNAERGTKYKIVLGHRRFEALKLLSRKDPVKWGTIQAKISDKPIGETQALLMNLKENLERVDLNMLQEAKGIERFKKNFGWDARRIGKELGKAKRWVEVRLGLLKLPEEIQNRAAAGYLTQFEIEKCIDLDTTEQQFEYVRNLVDHKLRGTKIEVKKKPEERKKSLISVMVKGESRTIAEMALVQESIQDSFRDIKHPAAMTLAWAQGVISYDELVTHIEKWMSEVNHFRIEAGEKPLEFRHHPQIEAKL